ncbi:GGDEF domain-containing protein [Sneathiella marina]|uniref:diguanylate cyclase n=1 Tax=Sneathiella marina TaxID=2950108 RepID=A0ABY4W7S5_9PROT|nr:GGDEF domain-containing protein [Sneathiella marina]USG62896.1 GGDEF domain-containing protein [Sneathiella marina]
MKISSTSAPRATDRSGRAAKSGVQSTPSSVSLPREINDTTSIMGIPEEELTPRVRDAIMSLMAEVDNLRQSLGQVNRRLNDTEQLADQDPLLPIYNRRAFVRELTRVQASVERYKTEASLVYIDLNKFKAINDNLGHEAGDAVLSQVAKRLVESVRDTDIVGRLGGDEFGLILSRTDVESARILINRIPVLFQQQPIVWNDETLTVGLSSGVVPIQSGSNAEQALNAADAAMYENKKADIS